MLAHTNTREAKVWQLVKTGNIANLKLDNTIIAPPKPSQVTVAVKAVGINFADVFTCLGLYQAAPKNSVVPGLEV
ncbi:hypothetical protein ABBQ32_011844 [Trebouxia sp. C0010 RCD-2024]